MNSFDDIKALWQQQPELPHPDTISMLKKARSEKQRLVNKSIFQGCCLLLTVVYVLWLCSCIHFEMATTYIGICLMIICVLFFGSIRIMQAIKLRRINLDEEPSMVLQQLQQLYKKRHFINTRGTWIYAIILNLAFAFYFIEVLEPLPLAIIIISLVLYVAWMLFALLVLSKRTIRKEQASMKAIMEKISQLETGLTSEE